MSLSLKAPRVTEVQLGLPLNPLHRHKGPFPSAGAGLEPGLRVPAPGSMPQGTPDCGVSVLLSLRD